MTCNYNMSWRITITRKVKKQLDKINYDFLSVFRLLVEDLSEYGPRPSRRWQNYSKLKGGKNTDKRHCHLIRGNPTYVCCWEIIDKKNKNY